MRMLMADLTTSTINAPTTIDITQQGGVAVGTWSPNYALVVNTQTDNVVPQISGESLYGTLLQGTLDATSITLKWTPVDGAYQNLIYKGYGDGTLFLFATMSGTIGTWVDNANGTIYTDRKVYSNTIEQAYKNSVVLPQPINYNGYFTDEKVSHRLSNKRLLTYEKGCIFNASLDFEQISDNDLTDLRSIKNWRTDMIFYPNFDAKGTLSYKVLMGGDFNFALTIPSLITGGWNGNMTLVGVERIDDITEVL